MEAGATGGHGHSAHLAPLGGDPVRPDTVRPSPIPGADAADAGIRKKGSKMCSKAARSTMLPVFVTLSRNMVAIARNVDLNGFRMISILVCVANQVNQDLLDSAAVAEDRRNIRFAFDFHSKTGLLAQLPSLDAVHNALEENRLHRKQPQPAPAVARLSRVLTMSCCRSAA